MYPQYPPQPQPPQPQPVPRKRKWWLWLVLGIPALVILGFVACVAFGMYLQSTPEGKARSTARVLTRVAAELTETARPTRTATATRTPKPTRAPTLTKTPAPTRTPKPTATATPDVPSEFDARYMCQQFVTDRLKAPTTAKFARGSEHRVVADGDVWQVQGYVDAQNSFGAMIRTDYICTMRYLGNERWRLEDLQTQGR